MIFIKRKNPQSTFIATYVNQKNLACNKLNVNFKFNNSLTETSETIIESQ